VTAPSGWIIHRYQTVASTMDNAARLAAVGARDRTAVVSLEQTAGRGRGGRAWSAPAGSALFCTLLIRPPVAPSQLSPLSLLTGVAVAAAIERLTDCPVRLKWPNDVWLGNDGDRAKVAGILVTSRLVDGQVDYALVGIGVNVRSRPDELPAGATSLLAVGVNTPVETFCGTMLEQFEEVYRDYLATAGRPSLDSWRARAAMLGEVVMIVEDTRERHGTFVDVDNDGAMLLRHDDGSISRIVAGDLVRGPKADPIRLASVPKVGTSSLDDHRD
jgi:BirA family biotin operon repressor/biotin-[acetyl-CoA-carboxylase] ligase